MEIPGVHDFKKEHTLYKAMVPALGCTGGQQYLALGAPGASASWGCAVTKSWPRRLTEMLQLPFQVKKNMLWKA